MLDLLRPALPLPLSAREAVAVLGRDLVADFAVVALAAVRGATVDSKFSTQPAVVQRAALDPSHAVQQ